MHSFRGHHHRNNAAVTELHAAAAAAAATEERTCPCTQPSPSAGSCRSRWSGQQDPCKLSRACHANATVLDTLLLLQIQSSLLPSRNRHLRYSTQFSNTTFIIWSKPFKMPSTAPHRYQQQQHGDARGKAERAHNYCMERQRRK